MKISSILISLSLLCIGCMQNTKPHFPRNEKIQLADEIRQKVALQLKKEKGLIPVGLGGGMMDQIRMLALSFNYYKPVTIEEGRELLISAMNTLVDAVNADKRIHPYLQNYPFTPANVEIRIFIFNEDHTTVHAGALCCLSFIDKRLKYRAQDTSHLGFKKIHQETYEEAISSLTLQTNKISL